MLKDAPEDALLHTVATMASTNYFARLSQSSVFGEKRLALLLG